MAALELWRGSGYKAINAILLEEKVGRMVALKYRGASGTSEGEAREAVNELRSSMKELTQLGPYYRGASKRFETNCHLETFVSVTRNKKDAEAFRDAGKLYTIQLVKGVKGIATGVEGEILLEDGCFWEYGTTVTIHPPSAKKGYPYCSSKKAAAVCSVPALAAAAAACTDEFELTEEERKELGLEGGKRWKKHRLMSRKYCKKTACKKMGFSQRSSCRPYKNCFTRRRK